MLICTFRRVRQRLRIVADHVREHDPAFWHSSFRRCDHRVGLALNASCSWTSQHQVAAAPQIETQLDVLVPVRDQLGFRLGQPDDAVDTNQNDRDDGQETEI